MNNNKNGKKILIIVVAVIALIAVVLIGFKIFKKDNASESKEFDITKSSAFFLKNSDSKYALFNEDGKQLTEFIYTDVGTFVNGSATVKVDDKVGIISENGKITVELGKYDSIYSKGGLYQASEVTEENYNRYLINGKGKVLYDLKEVDVESFIGVDTFLILENEKENKYTVINYNAKELVSFPKVDNDDIEDPSANEENNYISLFYNNKNWIFNVVTGKQIASFDSDKHYCVNKVSEDGKIITLNSCVSWLESHDNPYYKFIKDGKLYDLTDQCDKINYINNGLTCIKDSKTYLLDSDLKVGIDTNGKAYSNASNSYVMKSTTADYTVDFYQNGKVSKSVSCRDLKEKGYMESDIYLLGTHFNTACGTDFGQYEYYNSKGEKLFGKSFARAEVFDSNGLAKVSDDKKKYYLINKEGKQVGSSYDNISSWGDYYIVTNNSLKGLMDKEGNEVVPCNYSRIDVNKVQNTELAELKTSDSKYIIYDIATKKEIATSDTTPTRKESYFSVKNGDKTKYYTYSGKMFYEL